MKRQIELVMIDTDRNGDCFLLKDDWGDSYGGRKFVIEKGFRSDGISIPRLFWALVSPQTNPEARRAGVCHDWVYRLKPEGWTRAEADNMFFSFLRKDGFGLVRATACWLAVRLFGWAAWAGNTIKMCCGCQMDCKHCWRNTGGREDD